MRAAMAAGGGVSSNMQQTLTVEAAAVLKRAVGEAARRGHVQATPLHVAAALLSEQGSGLRRACLQAHPSQGPHLPHCRALELCFSIALDRLQAAGPASGTAQAAVVAAPPPSYSNALVAALKRAQAHQRRGGGGGAGTGASPGSDHHPQPPLLAVKVELDQLVISILDDPSVSRVMREAGFNSTDIKSYLEEESSAATNHHHSLAGFDSSSSISLNPAAALVDYRGASGLPPPPPSPSSVLGGFHSLSHNHLHHHGGGGNFSAYRPVVLAGSGAAVTGLDLHAAAAAAANTRPPLPTTGPVRIGAHPPPYSNTVLEKPLPVGGDGAWRQVVEVLLRRSKRNPVIVVAEGGGSARNESVLSDMARQLEMEQQKQQLLRGARLISANISPISMLSSSQQDLQRRLSDLSHSVQDHIAMGGGAIINLGDLQWLLQLRQQQRRPSPSFCPIKYVIHEIKALFSAYEASRRIWLVAIATEQTYVSIQRFHPTLESLWDLQFVSVGRMPDVSRYRLRTSICVFDDDMLLPLMVDGCSCLSDSSLSLSLFPSPPPNPAVADEDVGSPKLTCCSECMRSYEKEAQLIQEQESCGGQSESPRSHPFCLDMSSKASPISSDQAGDGGGSSDGKQATTSLPLWLRKALPNGYANGSLPVEEKGRSSQQSFQRLRELQNKWNQTCLALHSPLRRTTTTGPAQLPQGQSLTSAAANGTTRLLSLYPGVNGSHHPLRVMEYSSLQPISIPHDAPYRDDRAQANGRKNNLVFAREDMMTGCSPSRPEHLWQAVPSPTPTAEAAVPNIGGGNLSDARQLDVDALGQLCKGLAKRISWQTEVISTIANTVMQCRSGLGKRRRVSFKRDAWLLFLGSDRSGKRQMAEALSELLFGEEKKPICLSFGKSHRSSVSSPMEWSLGGDGGAMGRGKMPLDQLAEAVRHNPSAVVFLEDFEQADSMFRSSLLHAMERSRLVDSFGRDVNFNNVIVVMTSSVGTANNVKKNSVLGQQQQPKQQQDKLTGCKREGNDGIDPESRAKKPNLVLGLDLDLNMSAEENENDDDELDRAVAVVSARKPCLQLDGCIKSEVNEEERILSAARQHLREFCDLVDAAVVFACSPL